MTTTTQIIDNGENIVVNRVQDIEPIIRSARELHAIGAHGDTEMRHTAQVPKVVIEKYIAARGMTFHQFMNDERAQRDFLNDPAHDAFRIWKGRV